MSEEDKVYWLVDSEPDKPYGQSTWFRSMGIEDFVKKVEEKHKIVGVTFSGNNIGFILDNEDND